VRFRFAFAALATLATTPVMAAGPSGFYFGFDLGQSSYDVDMRGLESDLSDWIDESGLDLLDASTEESESAFTWGIIAGYQIGSYFAAEAGYLDLGEAEYKVRGTVTDGSLVSDVELAARMDSTGFAVSALGMFPIADSGWDVFGRVGVYFGSNDIEGDLTIDDVVDSGTDDTSSTSFLWGAGVSYTRGQWTSRIEYQQFQGVGDDGDFDGLDVNRIVFGAVYRTGFGGWR